MPRESGVVALYAEPGRAAAGARAARALGAADVRAAMPAPFPEVVEALGRKRSKLGVAVFLAALTGVSAGYALCVGTVLAWPLITGGKPIVSFAPFTVIGFESSVLVTGLTSLVTLLTLTMRARAKRGFPLEEAARCSGDRIGLFVVGGGDEVERALRESGAEEVRRVG